VLVSGDVLVDVDAIQIASILAFLNSMDGANLQSGTVATGALSKPKSFGNVCMTRDSALTATEADIFGFRIPNIDGAANTTLKYLGCSVFVAGTITKVAGCVLTVKKNTVAIHSSISLNDATLAAGVAQTYAPGSPVSFASTDYFSVDYTEVGVANYEKMQFVFFYSVNHVGT
jgi:hypothetical protein